MVSGSARSANTCAMTRIVIMRADERLDPRKEHLVTRCYAERNDNMSVHTNESVPSPCSQTVHQQRKSTMTRQDDEIARPLTERRWRNRRRRRRCREGRGNERTTSPRTKKIAGPERLEDRISRSYQLAVRAGDFFPAWNRHASRKDVHLDVHLAIRC